MGSWNWLREVAHLVNTDSAKILPPQLPDSLPEAWELVGRVTGLAAPMFTEMVANHFRLPVATHADATLDAAALLPHRLAAQYKVVPLSLHDGVMGLAVSDPLNAPMLEQLRFATGHKLSLHIQSPEWIELEIARAYGAAANQEAETLIDLNLSPSEEKELDPVVRLAQHILHQAIDRGASDIHMQPYLGGYLVRLRVDGVLARLATIPRNVGAYVIRHFKSLGGMDSTNALVPADGRASMYFKSQRIDLRLSTLPNAKGERLVIRLLDQSKVFSIDKLGYAPVRLQTLRRLTRLEDGLVLFVGPTGCGKTTALYGMLSSINTMSRSIATIEDPVEYEVAGLSQVSINTKQGVTFASALRAQLRQDPDVLLVGEIRDPETAEAAVRSALTGHLVFSTLHTSSARYAVPRLLDLGVSAPMLGETLQAVIAQRLVRKLCLHCSHAPSEPHTPAERLFTDLTRETPAMRAAGCEHCRFTGYKGVVPVLEIFRPSPEERAQLLGGNPSAELWRDDISHAETPDPDDISMPLRLLDMVVSGVTTAEEAARALGSNFWQALAQHFQHMGWLNGELTDVSLGARSEDEVEILVLGNDAGLAERLNAVLTGSGFHALMAPSTGDMRAFLAEHPNAGLLLADLEGEDTVARATVLSLRANFAWSGIPAIALVPAEAPKLAESLGLRLNNRMLVKPVSAEQIAEVILHLGNGN